MACYLPTGKEIGHAPTLQTRGYYSFCVCTIVNSSLRATNNGNSLQSSGGRTGLCRGPHAARGPCFVHPCFTSSCIRASML